MLEDKPEIPQCPMSFNNSGKNGYQLCFPNCAWWIKEKKECSIVTLAKKLNYI